MSSVLCLLPATNCSGVEKHFKVSNMVEGLEQELADITDSGDFAAYQVLLPTIEKFDLTILSTFPGIPCKLRWHLAPPPPLPAHHCTEEPDTVSLLQVSLSLSYSLSLSCSLLRSLSLSCSLLCSLSLSCSLSLLTCHLHFHFQWPQLTFTFSDHNLKHDTVPMLYPRELYHC